MENSILKSIEIGEKTKYRIMYIYSLSLLVFSFFFNSPVEIFYGLKTIITSNSLLLTDYMSLSNIGAASFNSGILLLLFIFIARKSKALMNGPLIASLFLVTGFALLGRIFIMSGVLSLGFIFTVKFRKITLLNI